MAATNADLRWGIDLGGTKIEGVDRRRERAGSRRRPRPCLDRERARVRPYRGPRPHRGRTSRGATGLGRAAVIGIGTPGAIEPASGPLKNPTRSCLNGRPLAARPDCRVRRGDSARERCELLRAGGGDARCGAGPRRRRRPDPRDRRRSGIVVHGRVLQGSTGSRASGDTTHSAASPRRATAGDPAASRRRSRDRRWSDSTRRRAATACRSPRSSSERNVVSPLASPRWSV